ncbi:hypothetical protein [Adhaeribacter radiodurans]|uniref:Uncharacterized protein n=1 Tax=Adhaeribacter radiodurans TaxID=2745197 RepID=A0A7L7L4L1_9BACT|nr:hypothetical protein [Adhaeribacter radiodurans]QMU27319.1 hypothetical protein HUW48_04390 [Adhaeribacter radiodurans]
MSTGQELEQIALLEQRITQLIASYHSVRESLDQARYVIHNLQSVIDAKDEEIKNFQNKDNISKIVNTIAAEPAHSTELKLKINEYIREIDKCIAYLRD